MFVDSQEDARLAKGRLLDAISDDDEVHGMFTQCLVWHKRDKDLAGVG